MLHKDLNILIIECKECTQCLSHGAYEVSVIHVVVKPT